MTRPTCQTCPAFHPGPGTDGTCRGDIPTLGIVLRLVTRQDDADTSQHTVRPSQGWFGRYPTVGPTWACCARHPGYEAYAQTFTQDAAGQLISQSTEIDDSDNI